MYYQRIQKTYLRQRRPRKGNSLACQQAGKRAVVLSSMSWGSWPSCRYTKVTRTKIVSQRTVPSYLLLLERKSCLVYKTGLYLWLILFLPANLIILAIHLFRSAKEVFKQFYYIFDFSILRRGEGCITIVTKNCMNSAASLELRRN
jgi:hypothetical protein